MLFLILSNAVFAFFILNSFNSIPCSWLCDYDTDFICLDQKPISIPLYYTPVFIFTFFNVYTLYMIPHSLLEVSTYLILNILLTHICLSDILYMIIPDQHILCIFLLGFLNLNSANVYIKLIGFLAGALPFFLLLCIGLLLKQKECVGFGDIKLMSSLGFLLGYLEIIKIYIISCLLSGLFIAFIALVFSYLQKKHIINHLPFAPFIIFSLFFCCYV